MKIEDYFSKENEESLAIDRLLNKSGVKEAKPLSLVADIIGKREEFTKEIEAEEKAREEKAAEEANAEEDASNEDDTDSGEDSGEEGDGWDDPAAGGDESEDEEDSGDSSEEPKDESKEEDPAEGSEWAAEAKGEVDGESNQPVIKRFSNPNYSRKVSKEWDFFSPIRNHNEERVEILNSFKISFESDVSEDVEVDNVDVANSKEAILESLTGLNAIHKKYVNSTEKAIVTLSKSISSLDERVLNFKKVYAGGKTQFNGKLFTDTDVLRTVAYKKDINLRESLRAVIKYLKNTNDVVKLLPNNPFDSLRSSFESMNFLQEGEICKYYRLLPGFIAVFVNLPEYDNYLKSSPLEYSVATATEYTPSEIYELNPVSITEEVDVEYLTDGVLDVIKELAISIDLLKLVKDGFTDLSDKIKILKVGVEGDEFDRLADLNIDAYVQDFIIFKLIVEMLTLSVRNSVTSITGQIDIVEHSLLMVDIPEEKAHTGKEDGDSGSSDWGSSDDSSSDDDEDDEEDGDGGDDDWEDW